MKNASTIYTLQRYPTRTEAVGIINKLIQSGVLSDDMVENLKEIKTCVDNETFGVDLFGAAYENVAPLFIDFRVPNDSDTPEYRNMYDQHIKMVNGIRQRYAMVPREGSVSKCGGVFVEIPDSCGASREDVWV